MFGLFVEWMFELAIGMTNRQDGARRLLYDSLRHAAHQNVRQSGATVGAEHDQVCDLALRGVQNFEEWRADLEQAFYLEATGAQIAGNLVEFFLREHALLLGDSAHRANVHGWSEFRSHHDRCERLIDVEHH